MPQVGLLPPGGNGVPLAADGMMSLEELDQRKMENNCALLQRLVPDQHAKALLEACASDAELGRMTNPSVLRLGDLDQVHFSARFPVVKGRR